MLEYAAAPALLTLHPGAVDYAAASAFIVLFLVVLGTLVWRLFGERWQRRRRERARVQALDDELNALLTELRPLLALPDAVSLNGAEVSRPPAADAVLRLLAARAPAENIPVERSFDRYQELSLRAPVLRALTHPRRTDETFGEIARRLDRRITELIGSYNVPRHIDPLHDPLERSYFFGSVHGLPAEELTRQVGMPAEGVDLVRERAEAIAADPAVAALTPSYLEARATLVTATANLRSVLA